MNKYVKKYVDKQVIAPLTANQKTALAEHGIKALGLYAIRTVCKNCHLKGVTLEVFNQRLRFNQMFCCKCCVTGQIEVDND